MYDAGPPLQPDYDFGGNNNNNNNINSNGNDGSVFAADMAVASAAVRSRFVSKVFGLLLAQLALVAAAALGLGTAAPALAASPALLGFAGAASLALALVLSCSERARRAHPLNSVLLCLFSAAQGALLAAATAGMRSRVVLDAVLVTAAAAGALCVYGLASARSGRDFRAADGMLLTALVCFGAVLLARAFLPARLCPPTLDLLISACGALLFASYIAFDVQLLARGDHRTSLGGPDDYVLAVLTIEVDLINLFSYVLELVQAAEGGGGDER